MSWKTKLQNLFERIDDFSDDVRFRLEKFDDPDDDVFILPFNGFGNQERLFLKGRVLEKKTRSAATETDSRWRNLVRMFRLFETDEVPHALVKAVFGAFETEIRADREGYFEIEIDVGEKSETALWHDLELELLEPPTENQARTTGQILIPPPTAKFGVISDIDDTVIKTNVTNKLKMLATTVLSNEHTRLPFEGVAEFYRALQAGRAGDENNPIFYVSSSPWNLYTLLVELFKKREIPPGPLFLKDFGTHTIFGASDHQTHKLENIRRVLNAYPALPFVLIGDDGEQDPQIYRQIVGEYRDKIRVIYIRKVRERVGNEEEIVDLIREVRESGSQIVFAPDSEFAALHAAGENLIAARKVSDVHEEKMLDKQAPKPENLTEKDLM
ncbi:MAG TPA: phosphatase domain-containing protein [Pyrinomonadaceae bacterium]|jgi:phosphatidate phosphatase APP1